MECGGQCLLTASCSAFRFIEGGNTCYLYDATYLYRDKTDTSEVPIYMEDSKWALQGNDNTST